MLETIKRFYRRIRKLKNDIVFHVKYALANEIVDIPFDEAWKRLNEIAPMPQSTAVVQHEVCEKQYDLVIIVPAYNAERWIRQCVDSIISQETTYSFLAIIIDDGSKDATGEILDSYLPNEHLKIIHQENKGYSGARNAALQKLISEYIMFVDSDDYILPGSIELLMSKAKEQNADIVEGNGFKFDESGKIGPVKECSSALWGGPCLKVIRSKLFACVEFPEGYLYEDKIIGSLIYPLAKKIITVSDEVYAYRIHESSITQKHDTNTKRVDSLWMMLLMENCQEELAIEHSYNIYQKAIRQIVFTYNRTVMLPEKVKKDIFIITAYFMQKNYSVYLKANRVGMMIMKSLENRDFGKYSELCKYYTSI